MNCEQARPLLLEYLLEEVAAAERPALAQHLKSCAACAEQLAQLRQTRSLLQRAEAAEEIPQRIRLALQPQEQTSRWAIFWRNSAQLAFASAALACFAIGLLALFQTNVSYRDGNFEIAFGARPASMSPLASAPSVQPAAAYAALDRDEVVRLIAEAVAASEARQRTQDAVLVRDVIQQTDQRRARDLREISESFRYLQSAQTMMWKDQVQSQHYVGALMQRAGMETDQP